MTLQMQIKILNIGTKLFKNKLIRLRATTLKIRKLGIMTISFQQDTQHNHTLYNDTWNNCTHLNDTEPNTHTIMAQILLNTVAIMVSVMAP
jgi:hypothetical protein